MSDLEQTGMPKCYISGECEVLTGLPELAEKHEIILDTDDIASMCNDVYEPFALKGSPSFEAAHQLLKAVGDCPLKAIGLVAGMKQPEAADA